MKISKVKRFIAAGRSIDSKQYLKDIKKAEQSTFDFINKFLESDLNDANIKRIYVILQYD